MSQAAVTCIEPESLPFVETARCTGYFLDSQHADWISAVGPANKDKKILAFQNLEDTQQINFVNTRSLSYSDQAPNLESLHICTMLES